MKTWKKIIQIAFFLLFFGYAVQVSFSAPVYIKNYSSFPAYPYNTAAYMQGGAYVGCGPTTGAMMMGYFHHVEGMSSTSGLLTNPGTGVNEGLNTAWTLHGSTYMSTGADGFGSVYNIEPGLENYATNRGYKIEVMIHVSPTYGPSSTAWQDYGPYGTSWMNDGDFWTVSGSVWNIDANKFCDFVEPKLAAGIAIFLTIDTNLDGSGDHWVALVGYDKATLKYAYFDTYSTTVQWADIYYCGATPRKDNSISFLRSVEYEGPVSSPLNPPLNVLAMNGYHSTIPLAWQSPATTLLAISTDMKTTESMDDANLVVPTANFPSDGSVLSSLFDANVGNMMSLPTQSSAAAPTGYNVFRSTSSGGSYTKIASNVQRLYYRDQSVTNGTHYYYKVTAVYSSGESGFSNIADAVAQANGYIINSGWTSTPPTLNGIISSTEWASAIKTNITYPGYTGTVTLYTMNDANKLYFAVNDGRDHVLEDDDTFGILFDDDYNRAWPSSPPSGEGLLQLFWDAASSSSLCAYMGISGIWPTSLWGDDWKTPTGVAQKISLSSGNIHYEGSIDLATSDLKASPGATIGILFYVWNGGVSGFDGAWPQETVTKLSAIVTGYGWCYGPFCYGDLKLATGVVTQPDISVTPATWNYGSVTVGSYVDKTFVVKNEGTATLNISNITVDGDITQFSVESGGGTSSLAPGATRNVVVRFKPTSAGTKNATARIFSNDPDENPLIVNITGTGTLQTAPDISINPTSWNYGAVVVGTASDKTFLIKNDGTANLNISATNLTGTNAADFSIQSGGGSFTLAPAATRNIVVRFAPTSAGSKSANLSISSNDPDENPLLSGLSGTATVVTTPDISSNPTSWNYGAINVGTNSDKTFTIKNDGNANLTVSATSLTGANASEFSIQSGGGSFTLGPAATRDIIVRFSPSSTGSKSAALRITSNDPDENPFVIPLSGSGTAVAGIPINPVTTSPQMAGIEFWVSIDVGTSGNPVTDLFGISFNLNYTNTVYINYIAAEAGSFIGTDVIFFPTPDDPNGKVSIGISRKSPQAGVNGFGTVARVKLIADAAMPNNTPIQLSISNVTANNSTGGTITLVPGSLNIIIQAGLMVWPGDTNNNGIVDQADILPLGLHWGKTGPARQNASMAWSGQLAMFWNPQAATYADANGDGTVNQADVLPIGLNWNKTHTQSLLAEELSPMQLSKGLTAAKLVIADSGSKAPNQDFFIDIRADGVSNLFGLSFELIYTPASIIDPLTVEIGPANLLGSDIIFFPVINKTAGLDSGKVSVGISRKSGQGGVSGSGLVTRIKAHMSANAVNHFSTTRLTLTKIQANDPNGNPIPIDSSAYSLITDIQDDSKIEPAGFALYDNYPNPFNLATTIAFQLPQPSKVRLAIYDLQGHEIRLLVHQLKSAGYHSVNWDGRDEAGNWIASGIYYYKLWTNQFSVTKKCLLIK